MTLNTLSAKNSFGIFKSKRAKFIAMYYNLPMDNISAYGTNTIVKLKDVIFIIDNLWLDHFIYNTKIPLNVCKKMYDDIYYKLQVKYSHLFFQ